MVELNKTMKLVPKAETWYATNKWYSFTINPSDKFQALCNPDRFRKVRNTLYSILVSENFYGVLEISEPRGMMIKGYSGPRIHIHGVIRWNTREDLRSFLLFKIYQITRVGTFDIDICPNLHTWNKYIHKQKILPRKSRILSSYECNPINAERKK